MRIPFALPLNVGTDIVAHSRLLKPNAPSGQLERLARRFLHPQEIDSLDKRFPGWAKPAEYSPSERARLSVHLAGRWAAKEAAKKAWGATLLSFKDIRVETSSDGQVEIICQSFDSTKRHSDHDHGRADSYEQTAKLSISHDGDYAVATVLATPLHPEIIKVLEARKIEAEQKVKEGTRHSKC